MAQTSTAILDHIVFLNFPGELETGIRKFKTLGFNVIDGGTHAGGLTYNALVVLESGPYIEIIAFTHPLSFYAPDSPDYRAREKHIWANLEPGWIDWAHLGFDRASGDAVNSRAKTQVYEEPVNGGRTRADGVVLKWVVTGAASDYRRGTLPFFCEDITPRSQRVPLDPPSNSHHTNEATRIAFIKINASNATSFDKQKDILTAVVGSSPRPNLKYEPSSATWNLSTPRGGPRSPSLELEVVEGIEGNGITEVAFLLRDGNKLKITN